MNKGDKVALVLGGLALTTCVVLIVKNSKQPTAMLSGTVTDSSSQSPLKGVTVIVGSKTEITDASGKYAFPDISQYVGKTEVIIFTKTGYVDYDLTITPVAGANDASVAMTTTGGGGGGGGVTYKYAVGHAVLIIAHPTYVNQIFANDVATIVSQEVQAGAPWYIIQIAPDQVGGGQLYSPETDLTIQEPGGSLPTGYNFGLTLSNYDPAATVWFITIFDNAYTMTMNLQNIPIKGQALFNVPLDWKMPLKFMLGAYKPTPGNSSAETQVVDVQDINPTNIFTGTAEPDYYAIFITKIGAVNFNCATLTFE